MDQKLIERFQKYENILLLFIFFTKTVKWLCKNFPNKKLEMAICQYDNFVKISNNEQMKLLKISSLMRKKMQRIFKFTLYR